MAVARSLQLTSAVLLCILFVSTHGRECPLDLQPGTTVLMVADPGTFSGTPEAAVYLKNLQRRKTYPRGASSCALMDTGIIMGQPVAVITTGIGPMNAAVCAFEILSLCGGRIKDLLYSGTSGWSPALGGIINNGSCETGTFNRAARIIRLGDVCVSPFSVNWDCRKASWSQTCSNNPNQCSFPAQDNGPSSDFLFGQCQFINVTRDQLSLAREVLTVAGRVRSKLPKRNAAVQAAETQYWSGYRISTVGGVAGLVLPIGVAAQSWRPVGGVRADVSPAVYGFTECMEIDSQFFWSGAPWDMVARKYVADTLTAALRPPRPYRQGQMVAVSAMEAIGLSQAMERYHALPTTRRRIPFTNVRGASNLVHQPLATGARRGQWTNGAVVPGHFELGYKYAIETASSLVLSVLQSRCQAARPRASTACTFTV